MIIICLYFMNKSNNKNNVSLLSYVNTKYNVPEYELLFLFINKYNDQKYNNYMNKILKLNLLMKPVYAIKKQIIIMNMKFIFIDMIKIDKVHLMINMQIFLI